MKIKFLLSITVFIALSIQIYAQRQTKSGIVISMGSGSLKTNVNSSFQGNSEADYKSNFSIGYRFRIQPLTIYPLFLDLDANLGMKSWHSSYGISLIEPPKYEASSQYYFVSASGTLNYPVYKGLSIGAGFEPTYYFRQSGENSSVNFGIPVVGKIAYNFKFLELGLSYKYGLINTIKTDYMDSGKFQDWQLSVWIPF